MTVELHETIESFRKALDAERASGRTVGLVPTMGYLHEGHASLMRRAAAECDVSAATIFVNPLQFAANEDLSTYPRDLDGDVRLAEACGVTHLFAPSEAEMYPDLAHKVKHVFDQHPDVHTIILGHTHVPLVRRFEGDRQYINSGCWTNTVSLDMESFGRESKPTYAFIEYGENGDRPTATLREWRGYHDIYRDILF